MGPAITTQNTRTSHYFTAIINRQPQPSIIKLVLPTNNDSVATTLLTMTNSEQQIFTTTIPLTNLTSSLTLLATTSRTSRIFLFQKVEIVLLTIYILLMTIKTKLKKQV